MRRAPSTLDLRARPLDVALLDHASRNSRATIAVQAAAAIGVVVAAGAPLAHFYQPWLWLTLAVLGVRLAVQRLLAAFLRQDSRADRLAVIGAIFSAGLIVSASLWAYLAFVRFPVDDERVRYVVIVVLSALAGGATGVLAPLRITGQLYISLILLPASLTMIVTHRSDTVLGFLGVIFWAVMLVGHRNNHRMLVDAIKLRDENQELLTAVARRSEDLDRLNHDLEERVVQRTQELENARREALAAKEAKSRFLAVTSHEMRTPLNAILGLGQILTRSDISAEHRDQVLEMKSAARHLRQMIDDIMDLSRLDDGELEIHAEPFCVAELAQSLDQAYRPNCEAKGLTFKVSVDGVGDGARLGDVDRLRRVVGELIANGLKFTHEGGVECRITGCAEQLSIAISDTGEGIAPDLLAAIFERFHQIDASSTREVGGLGLGLALCHGIATRMGGTVSVESRLGQGSTFTLTAPCPPIPTGSAVESQAALQETACGAAPPLLVVDDNLINRRILTTLMEQFGFECAVAADGSEALDAWRKREWRGIFMDIHMPIMDGVDATRAIRAQAAETGRPHVPIIAVTASLLEDEEASYREAGMDDVLAKPIEASALADILNRYIGHV